MLSTTDVGNVTQGLGFTDLLVLPIGGAQHVQAFCQLCRRFTARALCSGCLSYQDPAVEPRRCVAVGVCCTKALRWGLGGEEGLSARWVGSVFVGLVWSGRLCPLFSQGGRGGTRDQIFPENHVTTNKWGLHSQADCFHEHKQLLQA